MKKEKKKELTVLGTIIILGLLLYFTSGKKEEAFIEDHIERNEPGNGHSAYCFSATVGDIEISEVTVDLLEREYTTEECELLSKECREKLIEKMLAENSDLTEVTTDLNFSESLNGYPFTFSYETDTPEKIGKDGEILSTEDFITLIIIKEEYRDFIDEFSVRALVKPSGIVKAGIYKNKLLAKLEAYENVTDGKVFLPTEIDGMDVSYRVPGERKNPLYLGLSAVACVAVVLGEKRDEKKERKERQEKILGEYPVVLQKMTLYLVTGMTIRNIWQLIYEEGLRKGSNPLYEEMGVSVNEIKSGISEGLSYKRFGERTEIPQLVRFTALLAQNIKKGSSKLGTLLSEECNAAFVEKKQRAIKRGEEAGTKLLLPMMLLLVDVLLMIMLPAFWSM